MRVRSHTAHVSKHQGVEIDVRGWGDVLEGKSRPQFFKGVATVCTKLFNCIEPDHAYFGQKDIQQGLLLKILVEDLLLAHPTSENLHILPTARLASGLALSSRNAYLSPQEAAIAPVLFRALSAGASVFSRDVSSEPGTAETILASVNKVILNEQRKVGSAVDLRLDYVDLFDKRTFESIRGETDGREMVLAGAVRLGKTRLIDNVLLGWSLPEQ
ncbi:pantoate-beta-alanine ligase [Cryptococcus sp. DSM 104549]